MMLSLHSPPEERLCWVSLGSVDQIGRGQGRCFLVNGRQLSVFRTRKGSLCVLDASCPHRNGPLAEGIFGADVVICPFHGYKFSLIDGHGLDNAFSVKRYPTKISDGQIYVGLELLCQADNTSTLNDYSFRDTEE